LLRPSLRYVVHVVDVDLDHSRTRAGHPRLHTGACSSRDRGKLPAGVGGASPGSPRRASCPVSLYWSRFGRRPVGFVSSRRPVL
jgi:hypothetical protein